MNQLKCEISGLLKKAIKYKKALILGNSVAILATLLTVIIPLFIPMLVDELILHKSDTLTSWVAEHIMPMSVSGYLAFFLVLVLILRGLGFLLNVFQVKTFTTVSKDIAYNLRKELTEHLKRVSLKEYETSSPGAISSKLVTDIDTIDAFIGTTVSKFIISVLTLLFSAVVLLLINWKLALFILITNPVVVYFTAKLARNVGKLKRKHNSAVEIFQASLSDTLELFHQIRAVNKEDYFFQRVEKNAENLKYKSIEFSYKSDRAIRLSFLVFLGGYELFRTVSIFVAIYGDLSVGLMLAVFGYLWVMMTPTQDVINFQYALASARAACKRISDLMSMEIEPTISDSKNPFEDKSAVSIKCKDLSFSYSSDRYILKDIDIDIKEGEKIAIVGPSGSGKTTLSNIISGLYRPTKGEILYNGVSIQEIDPKIVRRYCHMILQSPKLFNDTLLFNLTLGRDIDMDKVQKAIDIAQLRSVVESMEEGLMTQVGRDGVRLSGGQRQRVAIARMILLNPKLVILDESTSALDIHTETKLFKALEEYLRDKTVITIAHRLSTIERADRIFVLEDGKIVDEGTHEELKSKEEGYFAGMI